MKKKAKLSLNYHQIPSNMHLISSAAIKTNLVDTHLSEESGDSAEYSQDI